MAEHSDRKSGGGEGQDPAAAVATGAPEIPADAAFDAEILSLLEAPAAPSEATSEPSLAAPQTPDKVSVNGVAAGRDGAVTPSSPAYEEPADPPAVTLPAGSSSNEDGHPFHGMQPLDVGDRRSLFGRDRDLARLVAEISRRPLCALAGSSGIGKTSLVRAGVFDTLGRSEAGHWHCLYLRLGADAGLSGFQSLAAVFAPLLLPENSGELNSAVRQLASNLRAGSVSLTDVFDECREAHPGVTFLLALDNFESVLLTDDVAERRAFLDCLLAAVPPADHIGPEQARLLLIMRSEALGQAMAYAPLAEILQGAVQHVMPMARDGLRQAIVAPAQSLGIEPADDLVEAMLAHLDEDASRLPRVQFCLREMWLQREDAAFDLDLLLSVGGLEGAVERRAEQLWAQQTHDGVDSGLAEAFRRLFGAFHAAPSRNVEPGIVGKPAWDLALEIAKPPNSLLVLLQGGLGDQQIGLAHESALLGWQRPADWRLEDDLFGRWQAGMASSFEQWRRDQGNESLLLSGALLAQAEDWLTRRPDNFDRLGRRFVTQSIAFRNKKEEEQRRAAEREVEQAQQMRTAADDLAEARSREAEEGVRRVRRNRIIATLAMGLSAASVALTALATLKTFTADRRADDAERRVVIATREVQAANQREARSRELTESAIVRIRAISLDRSAILASMANREVATGRPTLGLLLALQARQVDGETLDLDGLPTLRAVVERARYAGVPLARYQIVSPNVAAAWSPDGRFVAAGAGNNSAGIWDAQSNQRMVSLVGHTGAVLQLAFSPDGRTVATASADGTARLWDAASGRELLQFTGHGAAVTGVAISADGKWVATGSEDRTARVWDRATAAVVQTFIGHAAAVKAVAIAPDGKRLATASVDRTARTWEILSGAELRQLSGHAQAVTSVLFSNDGRRLITASADRSIRIWDSDRGSELRLLSGHAGAVTGLSLGTGDKVLASASDDRTVRIWNLETGETTQTLGEAVDGVRAVALRSDAGAVAIVAGDGSAQQWSLGAARPGPKLAGHTADVIAVAAASRGTQLVTLSGDRTLRLWDIDSGHELRTIAVASQVRAVALSEAKTLVTGDDDRNVQLWSLDSEAAPAVLMGHAAPVVAVSVSADGRRVASLGQDGTVKIWDAAATREQRSFSVPQAVASSLTLDIAGQKLAIATPGRVLVFDTASGQELRSLPIPEESATRLQFSPSGALLAIGGAAGSVRVFDVQASGRVRNFVGEPAPVASLAFLGDGLRLLVGTANGRFAVWSLETGTEVETALVETGSTLVDAAILAGGRRIATVAAAGELLVWDAERGHEAARFAGHSGAVTRALVLAEGRQLLTVSEDRTARIIDSETGAELRRLPEHPRGIVTAAVSASAARIATALSDGSIRLWDASGKPVRTLSGHGRTVRDIAFNPAGDRLVSASEDRTARIWDAQSGGEIRKLGPHPAAVLSVGVSGDGRQVVTGAADAVARIWDGETGRQLRALVGHRAAIRDVGWSSDGRRIATASDDGTVRLWNGASGQELRVLSGHARPVVAVAFSPDGTRVASASEDRTLRLWDVTTGTLLQIFIGHADGLTSVAFVPDGRRIVTASADRTTRVWSVFAGNDAWLPADLARLRPLTFEERHRYLGGD